jgi:hypothetical protein
VQTWPHLSLISSLLRAACSLGELDEMPRLSPIRKPRVKLPSCPSVDEIDRTIDLAHGWLRIAVSLAVFGGLRSGELRALQVRHVDLQAGTLHVQQAYSDKELTLPKGGANAASATCVHESDVSLETQRPSAPIVSFASSLPLHELIAPRGRRGRSAASCGPCGRGHDDALHTPPDGGRTSGDATKSTACTRRDG